jgi:hypothetical protein
MSFASRPLDASELSDCWQSTAVRTMPEFYDLGTWLREFERQYTMTFREVAMVAVGIAVGPPVLGKPHPIWRRARATRFQAISATSPATASGRQPPGSRRHRLSAPSGSTPAGRRSDHHGLVGRIARSASSPAGTGGGRCPRVGSNRATPLNGQRRCHISRRVYWADVRSPVCGRDRHQVTTMPA